MPDNSNDATAARMTLRIPASVYELVNAHAYLERRSVTGQLLHMVESGLAKPHICTVLKTVQMPVLDEQFEKHHIRIPSLIYARLLCMRDTANMSIKELFTALTLIYCAEANDQFKQAIARALKQRLPDDVFEALVLDAKSSGVAVLQKVIDLVIDTYKKP